VRVRLGARAFGSACVCSVYLCYRLARGENDETRSCVIIGLIRFQSAFCARKEWIVVQFPGIVPPLPGTVSSLPIVYVIFHSFPRLVLIVTRVIG